MGKIAETNLFDLVDLESTNKAFTDLKGLKELPKYKTYQVQDDIYGTKMNEWVGGTIKIYGKIFPNGKGCFYDEEGKEIEKEMKSCHAQIHSHYDAVYELCTGLLDLPFRHIYTGEWRGGKPHGRGKEITLEGYSYEGEWRNGMKNGLGKYIGREGNFYKGGEDCHDIALYEESIYEDGDYYKEESENDEIEGQATWKRIFGNSYFYEGEWENNMLHGQGTFISTTGDSYTGQWTYNLKEGLGKFTSKNGDSYTGEWRKDKKNGFGVVNCANGNCYEGKWRDDKLEVMVKFTYANGDSYTGGWEDDKPHGQGTFTSKNGDSYEGIFTNGRAMDANGRAIYTNGSAMDFLKIIITNSNNESHIIIKEGQSYFYQLGEGGEKINIDNEKTLKSALLQFGNKYLNQEIIAIKNLQELLINGKIKNPQELREFINEKLKELNNGPKENKSLPGQELMRINSCKSLSSQRVACQQR